MNPLLSPAPRRETLGANVLSQIKQLLITGQLMPGEQLSLRSTAQALGVSVMPVREAVYQLVADQALEVTPNRSVRVPVLSAEQFHEITQIRLQIEGYAVELAATRIEPAQLAWLRALNAKLNEAMGLAGPGLAQAVLLNKALHFDLYALAGMPLLVKMIESLWLRIGPILNYDLRAGSERVNQRAAVGQHTRILAALERGDAAAARKALEHDIQSAYAHILAKQYTEP